MPVKPASELESGDYLTGLDNGYVVEVGDNETPHMDGRYVIDRGDGLVSITFHTAQGEEGELIVPSEMPVTYTTDGRG